MRFLKLIALFVFTSFSPFLVLAQTATTTAVPSINYQQLIDQMLDVRMQGLPPVEDIVGKTMSDNLDIKMSPKSPLPNEIVRITVESYMTDLNKAMVSWSINGKVVEKGFGKTVFSFKNGDSGKTTNLTISIDTNTGGKIVREISLNPVGVTLMWEADTYTPPFYKGKALMSPQARVRAIAIPDNAGTRNALSAGNLVYVWKKDGDAVSEASGYGKNSFSFLGPIPYGDTRVSVQVSSVNDSVKSEMRLNEIPLSNPFILFYEKHPLLGTWYNRALGGDLALSKKEFSVSAEPYFFSNERSEAATIAYDWALNGKTITNPGRTITLRNETGEDGDSELSLFMRGFKQTFQTANRNLLIHFTSGASARPAF